MHQPVKPITLGDHFCLRLPIFRIANFVMDEIFSSTNPREGLSGAYAISDRLSQFNKNISLITTHYTELGLLEKYGKYKNYKIPISRDSSNNVIYKYK